MWENHFDKLMLVFFFRSWRWSHRLLLPYLKSRFDFEEPRILNNERQEDFLWK